MVAKGDRRPALHWGTMFRGANRVCQLANQSKSSRLCPGHQRSCRDQQGTFRQTIRSSRPCGVGVGAGWSCCVVLVKIWRRNPIPRSPLSRPTIGSPFMTASIAFEDRSTEAVGACSGEADVSAQWAGALMALEAHAASPSSAGVMG